MCTEDLVDEGARFWGNQDGRPKKPGARGKVRGWGEGLGQRNQVPRRSGIGDSKTGGGGLGVSGRKKTRARGGGLAGLGPSRKPMGVPRARPVFRRARNAAQTMAAALAEFGLRLGPRRVGRRGGRGRVSADTGGHPGGVARRPQRPGRPAAVSTPPARRSAASRARRAGPVPPPARLREPAARLPRAATHFRRAGPERTEAGAPGRSRRCHLGDARRLLAGAALSSSFWSPSSCHRKYLPL